MKVIIDLPDDAYELLKNKAEMDNIAESIIANGNPYEEREWIPVGERLPEVDMNVIFTIYEPAYCDTDIGFVEERLVVVVGDFQRIGDNRYWSWIDEYGDAVINNEYCKEECGLESFVTAWMPLPEPYKEANEDAGDNNNSDNMRNIGDDLLD